MERLYKKKVSGNSSRVTLGDPKEFSNRDSDKETNTIDKPFVPKKKN